MNRQTAAFIMPACFKEFNENQKLIFIKSIESVLNQTDQDFKLIIIDDGSKNPDLTAFLKSLKTASDKIVVIKNRRNRGPGYARNCGICFASKNNLPFILYNDADDISQSNRLECVRKVFEKEKQVNVAYSTFKVIDENDDFVNSEKLSNSIKEILDGHKFNLVNGENSWIKIALEKNYTNLTSATAVRTNLAIKELFPNKRVSEDLHTWLRYGAHPGEFRFLNDTVTYYRIASGTESNSRAQNKNFYKKKADTDVDGFFKALKIFRHYNPNVNEKFINEIISKFFFKEAVSIYYGNDIKNAKKLIKKSLKTNPLEFFKNITGC